MKYIGFSFLFMTVFGWLLLCAVLMASGLWFIGIPVAGFGVGLIMWLWDWSLYR